MPVSQVMSQAAFPKFFYKQKVLEEMIVVSENVHDRFQTCLRDITELESHRKSADQQTRLAAALSTATGTHVSLKVIVDPTILGGIIARIGDTVIDGSIRHRLEQLREQF